MDNASATPNATATVERAPLPRPLGDRRDQQRVHRHDGERDSPDASHGREANGDTVVDLGDPQPAPAEPSRAARLIAPSPGRSRAPPWRGH